MEKTIYSERNIAMMMDLYEMTMANGYFENGEYRLYVYVLDNTGFVSTANIPFQVID